MTVFSAVLLGIVQGITEFLPISSSAHLALAERLFGIGRVPDFYDLMLHLGTLITIFIAYWSEIWDMVMELPAIVRDLRHGGSGTVPPARRMILLILVGTLGAFGLYLHGVSIVGGVKGSMLGAAEPVSATVIAAVWLSTLFTWADWIGLALMVATIFLVALQPAKEA